MLKPPLLPQVADGDDTGLSNDHLKPIRSQDRLCTKWDFVSLWVGLVTNISAFYIAGSLVELGMSWYQGIFIIVFANTIILFPLTLTAHAGTRYGIPFPVLARSAFGIRGAHVPTIIRAVVACGWFSIDTWIGAEAISILLPSSLQQSPLNNSIPWLGTSVLNLICFLLFWLFQLVLLRKGMEGIKDLEKYSAPVLIFLTFSLLIWAYLKAGGFGEMLSSPPRLSYSEFWTLFFPSLAANMSLWSTISLNIPDFTRYAKTQSDQILGQIGLPILVGVFAFVGLAVASSTQVIFGHVISNPILILREIEAGWFTTIFAICAISLTIVTTNLAANLVASANALVNLCPSVFDFWRGALLTAVIGIICQPWRIFDSTDIFVHTWLVGYSALLGPIGGIIVVDYCILRRMVLDVSSLYSASSSGPYHYYRGYNLTAMAALVLGILPVVPGFLHNVGAVNRAPQLFIFLYNTSWFVTFFTAGISYWVLSGLTATQRSQAMEPLLLQST
ncbi:purine-uracil permease NCS1-like [Aristolochia californica]|uniref:purine-uracil permease NCS1-like n=1 Tax=Aristolochia californica TaxID=171875 RepID=UPI0035D9C740